MIFDGHLSKHPFVFDGMMPDCLFSGQSFDENDPSRQKGDTF